MKISKIIDKVKYTLEKTSASPRLDSELLVGHVLKKEKEYIYTYPEKEISREDEKEIIKLASKRAKGQPLAYILGKKCFYNLDFKVNNKVLIPRGETELVVDEVLELKNKLSNSKINIIDVGTGSGCIIISLRNILKETENFKYFGVDKYKKALKVAQENSEKNNFKDISFIKSDLLKYFSKNKDKIRKNNIIVANLPYLTKAQYRVSDSIKKEPKEALISKKGGLAHYEKLFNQLKKIKKVSKGNFYLMCEIDSSQSGAIKDLIIKKFGLDPNSIKIKKDLAGLNRLVVFSLKN
jgi:release factor glutamine methyltransferase